MEELEEKQDILEEKITEIENRIDDTSRGIRLLLKGISQEIEELKILVRSNAQKIDQLTKIIDLPVKSNEDTQSIKIIGSGLDILTKIPSHLRQTFTTLFYINKKATAQEIARNTKKSRPLESDYLNQLYQRGLIEKQKIGRNVYFYCKDIDYDNDNDNDNDNNSLDE